MVTIHKNKHSDLIAGKIIKISFMVSGIIATIVFSILQLLSESTFEFKIIATIMTFVYILLNNYILYHVFLFCSTYFSENSFKFRLFKYLLSYCSGFASFLLVYIGASFFTVFNWDVIYDKKVLVVFIVESMVFTTLIMIVHSFIFVQEERNKTKLENATLKLKSAEAVTLLLKQQIHPHFLFNSLHTIKVLYKDDAVLGEEYLVHLADFLRTSVSNTQAVTATVAEEIKVFQNYLNMQKIRFGEALEWNVNIENLNFLNTTLPAFSLQPLAENAIKHNQFSKKIPLIITVEQKGNQLIVSNSINRKRYIDSAIGTGLNNISERYFLLTDTELDIEDNGKTFSVRFQLN